MKNLSEAKIKYERALDEIKKEDANVPLVIDLLNDSMELGFPDAAYALATWYLFGTHVEQDFNKAVFLLKQASRHKYPSALYDLAVCYEEGKGVKKDDTQAFKLYLEAALRGDNQSVYEVGRCYYHGIGIKEDGALADIWLERAEELGIKE